MNLKDQLTEKKQALLDMEEQLKAEDVANETLEQATALKSGIEELEQKIEKAEKASEILKTLAQKNVLRQLLLIQFPFVGKCVKNTSASRMVCLNQIFSQSLAHLQWVRAAPFSIAL